MLTNGSEVTSKLLLSISNLLSDLKKIHKTKIFYAKLNHNAQGHFYCDYWKKTTYKLQCKLQPVYI